MNHEHESLFYKLFHSSMSKVYVFQAFLTFVKSLLGIFVPVYMFSIGYSIELVFFSLIGNSVIFFLLAPITINLLNKIGFKKMLMLSTVVYIFHIIILNQLSTMSMLYFHLTWITYGLYVVIFWPTMHAEIALSSTKKKAGNQIGNLQIIVLLLSSLAPILGGYYLEYLAFYQLVLLCFILLIIGSIPLLISRDIVMKKYHFSYLKLFKLIKAPKFKNSIKSFTAEGCEVFLGLGAWPLILFVLLQNNFLNLGILFSFVSLISVVLVFILKKYLDKYSKHKILLKIAKLKSLSWSLRILLTLISGFLIYLVESISKIVTSLFTTTYMSIFYSNSKQLNVMDYIMLREIMIHFMRILVGSLFLLIVLIFKASITELLVLSVILGILNSFWLAKLNDKIC